MDLKKPGHPPPGTMVFSQLQPGINETTIVVRVTRAWKSASTYDSTQMVANFVLLDEEDNQVHAIATGEEMDRIWPRLCEDLLYYITNFMFVTSPVRWRPVQSKRTMLFFRGTKIANCCKEIGISDLKFELQQLSTLKTHQPSMDTLIDVCGVLLKVEDMGSTNNDIDKLCITIMDSSCASVPVILWGNQATLFGVQFNLHRKTNTVLIVPGLRIKARNGQPYLSSTPATQIQYNPVHRQFQNLRKVVEKTYGNVTCRKPASPVNSNLNSQTPTINFMSIYDLHTTQHQLQQKFLLNDATIINLLPATNWSSDSCVCCSRDVNLQADTYYCNRCRKQFNPYITRSMRTILADASGCTGEFIMQPREIAQLTGISPMQLVCTTTDQLPQAVKGTPAKKVVDNIKGTKCSVEVEYYQKPIAGNSGYYVIKTIIEASKLARKRKTDTKDPARSKMTRSSEF